MTGDSHQPPTLLRPERQSLVGYVVLSVFGHGSLAVVFLLVTLLGKACGPSRPVIDLDESIEVSMVVLPKSETKMPDRAARAPVPKGAPTPEPAPEAPPPVKESDLVVKVEKPEPKPKPEGADEDDRRKQLMEQLERERLLEELANAPTGPVDRDASDPNSTSDVAINALGNGSRGDPEFARYVDQVQKIFMKHFRPLAAITQANPDLVTTVFIRVDPATGTITSWHIAESSNVPAFDAAAERAVTAVNQIPLPPAKYLSLAEEGYTVKFRAP